MADDSFQRRIPFAFLEDIKQRFKVYSKDRIDTALAYGMNEFSKIIAERMEYYSSNPNADRIRQVHGEIEQVKDVMVHNIERVLERGERIELLVDKTDSLNQQAFAFKKRSTALKVGIKFRGSDCKELRMKAIDVVEEYETDDYSDLRYYCK
ncbi:7072_t:CDS:2 [Paraglomus brasilianum]|uniref:Synaptobrevin homolog YKT6 n=1 Tax=Paraglomus brasilianum TaxID=144538 RepID=A0A9N8YS57_9GLOM|nr:7072_t:CDS:2 [Paraglomus brasilianum]